MTDYTKTHLYLAIAIYFILIIIHALIKQKIICLHFRWAKFGESYQEYWIKCRNCNEVKHIPHSEIKNYNLQPKQTKSWDMIKYGYMFEFIISLNGREFKIKF
jgi:hypothetical protein